ncbi:MAG: hypothetical protein RH942_11400 [Kiloniellaceae bacterium]
MLDQSVVAADRLKIGSVLGRSYAILLGNLSAFFVIALVLSSPRYILYLWLRYGPGFGDLGNSPEAVMSLETVDILASALEIVLSFVATGIIVYGTLRELQGRPAGLVDITKRGLATLLPVLLVSLAVTLVIIVGFAILVVPGLVFAVMFWVAVPVAVIERRSVRNCLKRSRALTQEHRWPVFGLLVLSLAMNGGFGYAIGAYADYGTAFLRWVMIEWCGGGLLIAFWAVLTAVTYFDLKRIKEGTGVDEIAAVFD